MNREQEIKLLVADRIKKYRKAAGLTQDKVYEDTGIHVGRIETGKHNISLSTLVELCDYLKMPLEEVFLKKPEQPKILIQ